MKLFLDGNSGAGRSDSLDLYRSYGIQRGKNRPMGRVSPRQTKPFDFRKSCQTMKIRRAALHSSFVGWALPTEFFGSWVMPAQQDGPPRSSWIEPAEPLRQTNPFRRRNSFQTNKIGQIHSGAKSPSPKIPVRPRRERATQAEPIIRRRISLAILFRKEVRLPEKALFPARRTKPAIPRGRSR